MITALKYALWAAHWLLVATIAAAIQLLATLSLDENTAGPTAVTGSVLAIWGGYLSAPNPRKAGHR